jgi:hypothetical protein
MPGGQKPKADKCSIFLLDDFHGFQAKIDGGQNKGVCECGGHVLVGSKQSAVGSLFRAQDKGLNCLVEK